jgi:hypothetical protein
MPHSPPLSWNQSTSFVRTSSIWSRKKLPIWGMRSSLPRYYNLINRQAGCPLNLPPPRAARLFTCLWRRSWAVWTHSYSFYPFFLRPLSLSQASDFWPLGMVVP